MVETERLVVVWRVTTRCNLSCGFCAYDRRLPLERHETDEESARSLGEWLLEMRARSSAELHVSFLGGEPFTWQPLPVLARHLSGQGLSLGLTTNGVSLLNAAARELVLDCFDEITLSIDGVGSMHDGLRGWPGGFDRLCAALRQLAREKADRGRGPLLRVNTVLMSDNVRQFAELCRSLAELGVQQVTFNRLGGRDRPEFFAAHRLQPAELERFLAELPELRRELGARGLSILGTAAYCERLLSLERAEQVSVYDCEPGHRFLFIDEYGTVAPCSFTLESYGEPLSALPPAAWRSLDLPRRFLARQRASRAEPCNDCASSHVFEKFRGA